MVADILTAGAGGDVVEVTQTLLRLAEATPGISMYHLIFEAIFAEVFRLPAAAAPDMWFFKLVNELLRSVDAKGRAVYEAAVRIICANLGAMELECRSRFIKWMAHFISHFDFAVRWADVTGMLGVPGGDKFVTAVFNRVLRLSYLGKMREKIPGELAHLLPSEPVVTFRLGADELKLVPVEAIVKIITSRDKTADDVLAVLEQVAAPDAEPGQGQNGDSDGDGDDEYEREERLRKLRLEVLLESALRAGHRTYVRMVKVVNKLMKCFKSLVNTAESRAQVVEFMAAAWSRHPQMMLITLDLLFANEVIDIEALSDWIFSPASAGAFGADHVWQCFFDSVDRVTGRTDAAWAVVTATPPGERAKLLQAYKRAVQIQKNAFIATFQQFAEVLTDHLSRRSPRADPAAAATADPWFTHAIGRFRQLGRRYHRQLLEGGLLGNLDRMVFADADPAIRTAAASFSVLHTLESSVAVT